MDTYDNIFDQAINADRPTLALFYEATDPRCQEELPVMRETASRLGGEAHFFEVDCAEHPELKERYHIHAFPTFILFSDGQEAWRATGRTPFGELKDMVDRFK